MAIYREKRKHRFTVIDNQPLQDANLSNKALGLLVRMLSFPDDWKFYEKDLEKRCDKDGREAIHNQMLELQNAGYVTKVHHRSEDGKFAPADLIVHEQPVSPCTGFPSTVKPSTDKPCTENPQLQNTNSTKYLHNKTLNKSSSSKSSSSSEDELKTREEEKINQSMSQLFKSLGVYHQITKKEVMPDLRQLKQIRSRVKQLSDDGRQNICNAFDYQARNALFDKPIGYLITMLDREIQDERNWNDEDS